MQALGLAVADSLDSNLADCIHTQLPPWELRIPEGFDGPEKHVVDKLLLKAS